MSLHFCNVYKVLEKLWRTCHQCVSRVAELLYNCFLNRDPLLQTGNYNLQPSPRIRTSPPAIRSPLTQCELCLFQKKEKKEIYRRYFWRQHRLKLTCATEPIDHSCAEHYRLPDGASKGLLPGGGRQPSGQCRWEDQGGCIAQRLAREGLK